MALILDAKSSKLYESWCRSVQGREVEGLVEATLRTMLNPQPGERVLDIGCGEGDHLFFFRRLGMDTAGIDASPHMIGRAGKRLRGGTDLKVGRAEDLPYEDNEFDLAVLVNTLEFLEDPLQALKEAGRVARQRVFIGVMNSLSWHYLRSKWEGFFRESIFNHLRFYDLWELKTLLREAFGEAPTEWSCARMKAGLVERIGGPLSEFWKLKHCPVGAFLGLSVSLQYRMRTDQHPLKIGLGEARRPVIKGVPTALGWGPPPPSPTGAPFHERGLSL
ncbi:MAG: class I SAM-dependent methyltransferase [Thermodesulfobacteriota bacterium]